MRTRGRMAKLGIVGAGQLGMFLGISAKASNLEFSFYTVGEARTSVEDFQVEVYRGNSWDDEESLKKWATTVDLIILENEFVPASVLKKLNKAIFPDINSYEKLDNKIAQKEWAKEQSVPVGEFIVVKTLKEVQKVQNLFKAGVLKLSRGGYDGYGNLSINLQTDPTAIEEMLKRGDCFIEKKVDLLTEAACMVAVYDKQIFVYPPVETKQEDHICHYVSRPTSLSQEQEAQIIKFSRKLIGNLGGRGIFAIEYFISSEGEVIFNEIAPRPHNSYHYSLDGSSVSQFEQLISIASEGKVLVSKEKFKASVMLNLLGTENGNGRLEISSNLINVPELYVHLYNKKSRLGRKMGHINMNGDSVKELKVHLDKIKKEYHL